MEDPGISTAERRYDRIARFYDWMEFPMERTAMQQWRTKLFSSLEGKNILEVGVGTGKNLAFYRPGEKITAIDTSGRMLERARKRAARLGRSVSLLKMDVQALQFGVGSFDSAVSTFVFCSVPDPLKGLEELRRVLKPKGKAYFLEHVRPGGFRGQVFDLLAPLFVRLTGANINRDTVTNIERAGFRILHEENLFSDIFKLIIGENSKDDFGERK
jgi:phosphatidylethanolamine/phosphatidyl-N-methylethanolamine N-methyltransferase